MADFLVAHLGHGDTPAELTPEAEALLSLPRTQFLYARSFIEALGSSFPAAVSSCMSQCLLVKTFRDCKGQLGLLSAATEQVAHDAVMQPACADTCTGLRNAHAQGEDILCRKAFEYDTLLLGTVSTPSELMHSHGLWAHAYGAEIMDEQNSDLDRRAVPHTSRSLTYLPVLTSTCCM